MFGFGDAKENYDQLQDGRHEAKFSHELLAGGASFAAFKAFEDHQRSEGKPVSHQFAKELLAGFAGAEVDKLMESKGADWIDRERAQHEAKKRTEQMYDQHYGGRDEYNPEYEAPEHFRNY
ncbi:hypothetical protein ACQRIT_001328 [Beauveria bassiana]|nr:CipC protein [Beauveria bassiana ARSEF 2860]KAF1735057.1 hypothetical protein CRV24_003976 [Beauveria bassiana]KGQ03777.1 hypothetical protein BBAD15_g10968 [Beauveria bassiana D1-5]EJP64445.1 CipC protein [Beauveria bassiana ARSEF 2860]KAH8710580.1 hypothetical protein HC256_007418 [Beauveria bassiana]KAH8710581.1 hypothetical protein HC256_007418 [Beauveria bassiana]